MTPEVKQEAFRLVARLARILGLDRGHFEAHVYDGQPTSVNVVDKSLKFGDTDKPITK